MQFIHTYIFLAPLKKQKRKKVRDILNTDTNLPLTSVLGKVGQEVKVIGSENRKSLVS